MHVAPSLDIPELLNLWKDELLAILDLVGLFVLGEHAFGNDLCGVENPRKCCSEQVSLLAAEGRVGVDTGIQITREDVLDLASLDDVVWATVWQLDPI